MACICTDSELRWTCSFKTSWCRLKNGEIASPRYLVWHLINYKIYLKHILYQNCFLTFLTKFKSLTNDVAALVVAFVCSFQVHFLGLLFLGFCHIPALRILLQELHPFLHEIPASHSDFSVFLFAQRVHTNAKWAFWGQSTWNLSYKFK